MIAAEDIKGLRRALNLKQRELAEKLGVSVGTIQNYEKGGVIPESKRTILANLMKHDPMVEKIQGIIKVSGDGNLSNTGNIEGGVTIDGNKEIKQLKARIQELEAEVKELKNDKAILKEFVTMLQNKK